MALEAQRVGTKDAGRTAAGGPPLTRLLLTAALVALTAGCGSENGGNAAAPAPPPNIVQPVSERSAAGAYLAGRHAADIGDTAAAADYFAGALAGDPENVELLQGAFALMAAEGRMAEASDLARRLLQYDANSVLAAVVVAIQDARAGDFAAASRRLEALPERGLGSFLGPLLTAWAKAGQGDIDGAMATVAPLAGNAHFAALHDFHAALINDLADRRDAAEHFYRKTGAGSGAALRYVQAAAAFFDRTGRPEEARRLFANYAEDHPDGSLLDGAAVAGGAKAVPSAAAGMAEALFGAATSVRQSNALDAALIFARLALELRPDMPLARILVADILQSRGRLAEANRTYSAIAEGSVGYWAAQLRIAANLDELGDEEGAARLLEKLAAERPQQIDALVALGEILRTGKRYAEAVAAYDRAIARLATVEKRHWVLFYSRGISLERSGQWARAESDLRKALELEPDQPHVLNYLGYSWVEQGAHLDEAKRMIERAVELRPNDGYIVDSLGWVLYRRGDFAEAVRVLERAVELRPEDPTVNDHLGDALWRVGRYDEARFQWQRALSLDPEPELVGGIRGKIVSGLEEKTAAGPAK